jgi:hypothetical protein
MVNYDAGRRPLGLVAMGFTRDSSAAQSAGSRQIRQAFVLPTFIATRQSDTSPPSRLTWCVLQVCPKFRHRLTAIAGLTHHKLFTSSLLSHCFQSPLRLRKSVHNSSSSSIENISSLVVVSWATKKDLHTKSIQLGCATPTPHRPLSESAGDYMLLLLLSYLQLLLHTVWCDNSSLMESHWHRALLLYPCSAVCFKTLQC